VKDGVRANFGNLFRCPRLHACIHMCKDDMKQREDAYCFTLITSHDESGEQNNVPDKHESVA
jgi:hypothetical protein